MGQRSIRRLLLWGDLFDALVEAKIFPPVDSAGGGVCDVGDSRKRSVAEHAGERAIGLKQGVDGLD